jgi:hypothetical protein
MDEEKIQFISRQTDQSQRFQRESQWHFQKFRWWKHPCHGAWVFPPEDHFFSFVKLAFMHAEPARRDVGSGTKKSQLFTCNLFAIQLFLPPKYPTIRPNSTPMFISAKTVGFSQLRKAHLDKVK